MIKSAPLFIQKREAVYLTERFLKKGKRVKKIFFLIFALGVIVNVSSVGSSEGEGETEEKKQQSFYNFRERRQFRNLKKTKGIQTSVFWSGPYTSQKVALTFDDGPHQENTLLILKALEEKNILATFFLIGENAETYPELVLEIKRRGHEIGNHSYSHPNMGKANPVKVIKELRRTQRILKEITGSSPTLFRPPYGTMMLEDLVVMPRFGLKVILWTVDSKDWFGIEKNQIEETILGTVTGGSIILYHEQCPESIKSLPRVIDVLKGRGYEFVPVSEIIKEN